MEASKTFTRRSFLVGCGLLTFTATGITLTGCGGETTATYPDNKLVPEGGRPPRGDHDHEDEHTNPEDLVVATTSITLSQSDYDTLTTKEYLSYTANNLLLFYINNEFYAMTNVCSHENGLLIVKDSNTIECQKHLGQVFDKDGVSNQYETRTNLMPTKVSIQVG